MPFYEYECENCKFYTEVLQKITDAPLRKCPSCGKNQLKKLVSAPVFRLKGAGWYETDFKSDKENKRNLAVEKDAESASSDKASETADSKAGDKASEAKSETKSDAKSGASEPGAASGARSTASARGTAGAKTAAPPSQSKGSSAKAAESRRTPSKPHSRSRVTKPAARAKSKSSKRR
jgi:putative FmdB family regulatory protein